MSPTGKDEHPGTEARPFRTVARAREAVRGVNRHMTGDIHVVLRGGTHVLDKPLILDHRDSGMNGHNVVYKARDGQTPVISGGRPIRGWQPDAEGRWKARTTIENFRQLYVNGRRATRAHGGPPPGIQLHGADGYRLPRPDMAGWRNPEDIEFCYFVAWTHSRCKVKSIAKEGDGAIVTMLQPHFTTARTKEGVRVGLPSYIENAFELLDEPGEWYLDRAAHTVTYIPRPGEDMKKAEVIAPALEKLVELRGTLDQPVHHIHFVGLTFAHATWLQPSDIGHPDVQANFLNDASKLLKRSGTVTTAHNEQIKSPSNIVARAAKAIRFEVCTFTHLGSGGLDIEFGSQDNAVVGCEFHDISGTAIQIGDVLEDDHHPDDPRKIVKNNTVANCYVHDCGVEFKGSVGIFVGYTDSTVIAHNEISSLPYTGVSVGWGWGEEDAGGGAYGQKPFYDTPTTAKNNRIDFNHIHHVMQRLNDGGGIYTLSIQPGTVIRGNHIHDNRGGPGGIYLDEGSGSIEVTANCVYNVPRPMNFNNRAQNRIATCKVHDNAFHPPAATPGAARPIIEKAGLEPACRDLLRKPKPQGAGMRRAGALAFVLNAAPAPTPGAGGSTTEAGHYTYADTAHVIAQDAVLDTWEVECAKPGRIQLLIWRQVGRDLVLVGKSEMVEMAKAGASRFSLKPPIAAKKGDIAGFYIRSEATHIAASHGGRMLFVDGVAPKDRMPLRAWQIERKIAHIRAFRAAERARPRPPARPPRPELATPGSGVALQNFPPGKLHFCLYDLAAKKPVSQGGFERGATLNLPAEGRHFFLVVSQRE